ncbi:MAG: hypothetical protein ACI8WB_000172 [Phenylobacterium sp.]|jgi:hypothetical protein
MQTKLTLRLDDSLIQQAKDYAKQNDKSLSQVVADYFHLLIEPNQKHQQQPTTSPITQSLIGLLATDCADTVEQEDYKKHLEEKYL